MAVPRNWRISRRRAFFSLSLFSCSLSETFALYRNARAKCIYSNDMFRWFDQHSNRVELTNIYEFVTRKNVWMHSAKRPHQCTSNMLEHTAIRKNKNDNDWERRRNHAHPMHSKSLSMCTVHWFIYGVIEACAFISVRSTYFDKYQYYHHIDGKSGHRHTHKYHKTHGETYPTIGWRKNMI